MTTIQPTDKFTFELTGAELMIVLTSLANLPYGQVKDLIAKFENKVIDSMTPKQDAEIKVKK
jgi:hypothetical protein